MILILLNPTLFGISIFLMIPFFILSSIVIVKNIPKFRKNAQESFARYTNWMGPIVESGDAIAVFGGQDIVLEKVREESEKIMRENVKGEKIKFSSNFVFYHNFKSVTSKLKEGTIFKVVHILFFFNT